ncbi:hypothetical protein D0T84_18205 [Dysgonomonas sp. 521]|uniref:energy transducer TonB n=1 Tax=Dysgonomonas sp. 521 TaxID=2302932 RepID=UPI0013D75F8C|nr:energy transducer TonB [Dysgonomonas sp. 521]NDV96825.1 hypothetical protein [Dysgonomonas sp. 521]
MKKINLKNITTLLCIVVIVTACSRNTSKEQQKPASKIHNEEQNLTSNAETLPDSVHIADTGTMSDVSRQEAVKDVHIFREGGTLPEYPSGDVWQYMNDNVRFPAGITLNRSDNSVIVHFIVEKDGSLNSFSLYAGSYPALDAEVLRVAKTMTKWRPGKRANGEIVATTYLLGGVYQSENGKLKLYPLPAREPEQYQGEVFDFADKHPQFPGGVSAMRKFISDNMQYPAESIKYKEEGNVVVQFIVSPTGEISDVFGVVRCRFNEQCSSTSLVLAKEAERIVGLMPNWIPGENKGKKVAVRYALPIKFKLP